MKLGTYHYKYAVSVYPRVQLSHFTLRVEVLEEKMQSTLRYKVRFLQFHADKRGPNTVTWVKASSVKLDDAAPAAPLREVRLPYKDD